MEYLKRLIPLFGETGLETLRQIRVLLVGVGGVGSFCAEALVRSGISDLALLDFDTVAASNVNRQIQATMSQVGRFKVDVLAERLKSIRPNIQVIPLAKRYARGTADAFNLEQYDVVIDAIDSLTEKADLLISACRIAAQSNKKLPVVYSSLGAAGRLDPTCVRVADIWNTSGCALGKQLRSILRKEKFDGHFKAVYSIEKPCVGYAVKQENENFNRPLLGSAVPVTATFGMTLASLVLQHFALNSTEK